MAAIRRHLPLALGVCAIVVWTAAMGMLASGVMAPAPSPVAIVPSEPEPSQLVVSLPPELIPSASLAPATTETAGPSSTSGSQSPAVSPRATTTPLPTQPTPAPPTISPVPSPLPTPTANPTPAATPAPTPPPPLIALACANGVDNGGGTGTICEIVITPFAATVVECHGAAGDPRALCTTTGYAGRVTSVDACNGTANGGGATLRCSVTGVGFGSASVTLCVGSGAGGTLVGLTCTWSGSSGVTVSLCNGSGNGGGALVICTVD